MLLAEYWIGLERMQYTDYYTEVLNEEIKILVCKIATQRGMILKNFKHKMEWEKRFQL